MKSPQQRPTTEGQIMSQTISPDAGLKILEGFDEARNALLYGSRETMISFIKAVFLRVGATEHDVVDKLHGLGCGHLSDEAISVITAGIGVHWNRIENRYPVVEGASEQ